MEDNFGFGSPSTFINMDSYLETPVVCSQNLHLAAQSIPLANTVQIKLLNRYTSENGQKFLSEFDSYCVLHTITDEKT